LLLIVQAVPSGLLLVPHVPLLHAGSVQTLPPVQVLQVPPPLPHSATVFPG
jgi:ABC-type proline/glycine betaine transport system permease subunit